VAGAVCILPLNCRGSGYAHFSPATFGARKKWALIPFLRNCVLNITHLFLPLLV